MAFLRQYKNSKWQKNKQRREKKNECGLRANRSEVRILQKVLAINPIQMGKFVK